MKSLSELLKSAGLADASRTGDAPVGRVVSDSRDVRGEDCFVAVRGVAADGHRFIPAAAAAGCSAVVCEDDSLVPPGLPRAVVPDTREALGPLAQAAHDWPARRLTCSAVTGTNGKTTFTYLLRDILRAAGRRPGLIGTIAAEVGGESLPAATTTPGPVELAALTARLAAADATDLVMEASSHALDQRRTEGVDFAVAAFTNLSGDHLDYHGDMAAYAAAKRRLFEGLSASATAVLNRDDPASEAMAAATAAGRLWYGLSPAADLVGAVESLTAAGSVFGLRYGGAEAEVRTSLIGRHNVLNCCAAAAAAVALGVELTTAAEALSETAGVPGRLERVGGDAPFEVLVDYAHTDDALRNVLSALGPLRAGGRLIVVFGCGGDRDAGKRPRMAAVAEELADRVIVTSDNPRGERPEAIIEQVLAGLTPAGRAAAKVEADRRAAIVAALAEAAPGDIVLIAGKGHETYQILGRRRIHFDDREVAREWLRESGR
jgi:UDP-N-acetylmuramoyl-L-alanyl-D-glutamate--2,6-diaminopimelate ligase